MELREYIRIILNNLWIIIAITLIALTASVVFTYEQTPIYESTSTFITGLGTTDDRDQQIYLSDTLLGRQRIFVTQCDVIKSGQVLERALELLNLTIEDVINEDTEYTINCNVMPESNVLLVIVQGPAPMLVARLNEAVGLAGMERVNQQFGLFPIERLDPVFLEEEPISPNYSFNLVLGAALGLVISITVVMLLEYLQTPQEKLQASAIREPRYGVYNARYFQNRLTDEIIRAKKWHNHVTLILIRLNHNEDFDIFPQQSQDVLIRTAVLMIEDNLRDSDILGYHKEDVFAILMPQTSSAEAYEVMQTVHETLRSRPVSTDGLTTYFTADTGIVDSSSGKLSPGDMMEKALEALDEAVEAGDNEIRIISATSVFVFDEEEEDDESSAFATNMDNNSYPQATPDLPPSTTLPSAFDETDIAPSTTEAEDDTPDFAGADQIKPEPPQKKEPRSFSPAFFEADMDDSDDTDPDRGVTSDFLDSLFDDAHPDNIPPGSGIDVWQSTDRPEQPEATQTGSPHRPDTTTSDKPVNRKSLLHKKNETLKKNKPE